VGPDRDGGGLSCSKLVKVYGKRRVVDNVSINVRRGEIVGLLGPNGAGKTTCFYMIVGMIRPEGGVVKLDGEEMTNLAMYKRARKGLGYLPQEASIFRKLTVEQNLTRSLVTKPSFMLLDEPFAGIDPIAVADLQSIVTELRERGLGVLITDHNVRETLSITDRAYIMYEGSIKCSGTADELASDPEVREIYLGEAFRL
jgi:lipopolysaccharide export system ATP-binding protein